MGQQIENVFSNIVSALAAWAAKARRDPESPGEGQLRGLAAGRPHASTMPEAPVERCPHCGSQRPAVFVSRHGSLRVFQCPDCGRRWSVEVWGVFIRSVINKREAAPAYPLICLSNVAWQTRQA
jgi:DNA-directed RNA polymerase subunit RPC12/RpoP